MLNLFSLKKILEIETKFLDLSCSGSNDGEVEIFVSGGRAPYNIEWITDVSYEVLESDNENGYFKILSSPGFISATVSDSTNNCGTLSTTIEIKEPESLIINELSIKNNICYDDFLGEYEIYVSGLTDSSFVDYELKWFKFVDQDYVLLENDDDVSRTEK